MTSRHDQLWELISTHPMPETEDGRPFYQQLMDEHGIRRDTALAAIEEYRKFIFLCATRSDRNVPSKAVDLVWHQHMLHSRDYWDVFCKKLGQPIHHSPGGAGQGHLDDYKATVAAYTARFGRPPRGIWRQRARMSDIIGLLFALPFLGFGLMTMAMADGFAVFAFGLLFAGVATAIAAQAVYGLTTAGELHLTFETGDPFADTDSGDCGSGDGGGCGD